MLKKILLLMALLTTLNASGQEAARTATNQALASQARLVCVESRTHFMKAEALEKALLGRTRFHTLGLQVTRTRQKADLVISVVRSPFQNNFPYAVTDRATGTVVFGGEVNSLFGTVHDRIANDFLKKLEDVKEGRTPGKKRK